MGTRVLVLALREMAYDGAEALRDSLQLVVSKLQLLKASRPYTVTLLLQLDVDLEALGDLNPTGHITTLEKARENSAETIDNSRTSPVNLALKSDVNTHIEHLQSQNMNVGPRPASTYATCVTNSFMPRPNNVQRAYTDPVSDLELNFVPLMHSTRFQPRSKTIEPTSMPLGYDFSMGSTTASIPNCSLPTSLPDDMMTDPQFYAAAMQMGMTEAPFLQFDAGIGLEAGACEMGGGEGSEWDADLTWNHRQY